ncbi:Rrf2 family transcriptional regulator [Phenylobacterium kunshanense]|uniref:Rrf2 family transcriptional regulator n=1 Tax=Phenylobacterium kunshanense TaxID=1445034 RepID=A0A328BNW9_9CAUL|nr:Rrf2 family transcriptional regulator [Phenylobacterium kunshanense]RAK69040.1 Rrf2 family transcriptional regulator [Phenylobacterium kunshanense]
MRLSTKGRYAVMAMADLARRESDASRAVALADIASRQEISLSYLEQLFARLRRKGLVKSARGPGGGYRLARAAEATTIADIVHAVDEPLRATRCQASKGCMMKGERCLTHDLWADLGAQIEGYLSSVSLADVIGGRLRQDRAAA